MTMLAEAFMNFRMVGAVIAGLLLHACDAMHRFALRRGFRRNIVAASIAFYLPIACLLFARGSGIDLAAINVLVVAASAVPLLAVVRYGGAPREFVG